MRDRVSGSYLHVSASESQLKPSVQRPDFSFLEVSPDWRPAPSLAAVAKTVMAVEKLTEIAALAAPPPAAADPPAEVPPAPILDDAPKWWSVPDDVTNEAEAFDGRHRTRVARAKRFHQALDRDSTSISKQSAFHASAQGLLQNRYKAPYKLEAVRVFKARKRKAKVEEVVEWSLPTSIWAGRAKWCDSRDFWDTDFVEHEKFETDWNRALKVQDLAKTILRADDGADGGNDDDGDGIPDEVQEVRDVLWDFHDLYFQLFSYYASLNTKDITSITFNGWAQFVSDCKLASMKFKFCKKSDCDRIFIAVDSKSRAAEKEEKVKGTQASGASDLGKKELSRFEFLTAVVQLAIARYTMSGQLPDVSDAVARLLTVDVKQQLDVDNLFAESNVFRDTFCYNEPVDIVLRRHEANLRLIFGGIAGSEGASIGNTLSVMLCDLGEWKTFLRGLGLVGPDLTDRDGTMCFCWARMAVIDGESKKGSLKERNLPFEGFLEAICRLSVLKALPTDDEIATAGFSDAGLYMRHLKETDENAYEKMLAARAAPWPGAAPQPIERCVEHIITIIIRSIEEQTAGADDMSLDKKELCEFMEKLFARG